jgi:hypothetical protein
MYVYAQRQLRYTQNGGCSNTCTCTLSTFSVDFLSRIQQKQCILVIREMPRQERTLLLLAWEGNALNAGRKLFYQPQVDDARFS